MSAPSVLHSSLLSSFFVCARIGGAAAGLAAQFFLLHALGPTTVGTFFLAASVSSILGVAATLGYPSVAARFIARYVCAGRDGSERAFVQTARRDALALASVLALALVSLAVVPGLLDQETSAAMVGVAFAIPAVALLRVNGAVSMARFRFATAYLPDLVVRSGCFLVFVVVAVQLLDSTDAHEIAALFAAAALIACILQMAIIGGNGRPAARPRRSLVQLWRRASTPFVLIALAAMLLTDIAVVIAAPLLPRYELAAFVILLKVAFLVGFAVDVLHDMAAVRLAHACATGRRDMIAQQIHRTNALSLAAVLIGGSAAALGAGYVLERFDLLDLSGAKFATLLVVLLSSQLIRAVAGPAVGLLTITGNPRHITISYAVGIAAMCVASLVLAPDFGLQGAVIAVVLAVAVMNLGFCTALARSTGLRSDLLFTLQQAGRTTLREVRQLSLAGAGLRSRRM